ncbi:hypothetical protein CVT26_006894 [Gymnopilus dilepis]|uniref:Uncharacterized protein n=1 Tax=Gymnopilus dilepis TaxID=231916 RepID=A0A409W101_9AGAR|nr:hypothetical protein CVT26_006894 [Gymnopilus dilepis]
MTSTQTIESTSNPKQLVWLITGTSSGIGLSLARAALSRGDKVLATARSKSINAPVMQELKEFGKENVMLLELDVTSGLDVLKEVAKKAVGVWGRVDVVVNNAGYVLSGMLEENSPQETFDQFNTNLFGGINVTRAFLPYMRERKRGTIVWIGSIYGFAPCAYGSAYVGSKWATRGMSLTLNDEISHLGLRSIVIDFGYFRTGVLDPNRRVSTQGRDQSTGIEDYRPIVEKVEALLDGAHGRQPGDPAKGAQAVVDIVRGEGKAAGKPFPREVLLGTDCYQIATDEARKFLEEVEVWKDVSFGTDFAEGDSGIGNDLALAALQRGDKVLATARSKSVNSTAMQKLKEAGKENIAVLELDVTSGLDTLKLVAREAVSVWGRVDVVVNNAGYVLFGVLEENTYAHILLDPSYPILTLSYRRPQETYDQFNTNLFGALNVTRAFLPYMRERKTGTVVWIGSMYGLAPCAYGSAYVGTKWAMRGMSMTLDDEISSLGLRSIVVDFGYFRTAVLNPNRRVTKNQTGIEDYKPIVEKMEGLVNGADGRQPGDPRKGAQAIVDVVRGEGAAAGKPFPRELLLGTDCYQTAKSEAKRHLEEVEAWQSVSCGTDFTEGK